MRPIVALVTKSTTAKNYYYELHSGSIVWNRPKNMRPFCKINPWYMIQFDENVWDDFFLVIVVTKLPDIYIDILYN